jgi:outer membrane lipase/esterase
LLSHGRCADEYLDDDRRPEPVPANRPLQEILSLRHRFRLLLAPFLAVAMLTATEAVARQVFDRIVVIGDSLSDMGNAGRFSNGPVWVEGLADRLGLPLEPARAGGTNYAIGGARLDPRSGPDSLRSQTDQLLRSSRYDGRTLFVVFGGANDLLGIIGRPDAREKVEAAVAALHSIVADLVARGATDLLVPNLPDLGMAPAVRAYGRPAMMEAERWTTQFNAAADRVLQDVQSDRPFNLIRLDIHAMGERAMADPAAFGFTDVMRPCRDLPSCAGFLFWDPVHPTAQAHERLADAAARAVSAEQDG